MCYSILILVLGINKINSFFQEVCSLAEVYELITQCDLMLQWSVFQKTLTMTCSKKYILRYHPIYTKICLSETNVSWNNSLPMRHAHCGIFFLFK